MIPFKEIEISLIEKIFIDNKEIFDVNILEPNIISITTNIQNHVNDYIELYLINNKKHISIIDDGDLSSELFLMGYHNIESVEIENKLLKSSVLFENNKLLEKIDIPELLEKAIYMAKEIQKILINANRNMKSVKDNYQTTCQEEIWTI